MGVVLALLALFCVLTVLSWIISIPIAIIAFLIKIAPVAIVVILAWAILTGRIEIKVNRRRW